eukprot:gene36657-41491_t
MAVNNARDVYTRRNEGVSIWVVKATDIVASSPGDKDALFEPSNSKVYRHPTFFPMPEEGDNALILSQRLSELCGKGPALEEDMALTNV